MELHKLCAEPVIYLKRRQAVQGRDACGGVHWVGVVAQHQQLEAERHTDMPSPLTGSQRIIPIAHLANGYQCIAGGVQDTAVCRQVCEKDGEVHVDVVIQPTLLGSTNRRLLICCGDGLQPKQAGSQEAAGGQ